MMECRKRRSRLASEVAAVTRNSIRHKLKMIFFIILSFAALC